MYSITPVAEFSGHGLNWRIHLAKYSALRAVRRSEYPGVPILAGGHNLTPLVEIGLTDLPKSGGATAPPAPIGATGLQSQGQEAKVRHQNHRHHHSSKP